MAGLSGKALLREFPDINRCQAEKHNGYNLMTLGGRPEMIRCGSMPKYLALENKPQPDGFQGIMSVCQECKIELIKQLGVDHCTFAVILREG